MRGGRLASSVGLVLLLLVDLALVALALRIGARSRAAEQVAVPGSSATLAPEPTATPSTTASGTTSVEASSSPASSTITSVSARPLQVLLSADDGVTAWRATTGACGSGGATLSVSGDGGKTWRTRTTPFAVLSRLQATDASRAFVVGASSACAAGVRTTSDGGATWPGTGVLADTLTRDPNDANQVRAPGNRTVAACDGKAVIDLARSSTTAAQALCASGSIRGTSDDGNTWPEVANQPGAVALDSRAAGNVVTTYLAVVKDGCNGIAVESLVGATPTDLACVAMPKPAAGTVALSVPTPDAGWLLVGNTTWRSANGLKTWAAVEG